MTKLYLDDFRNPPDSSWNVVRSYDAFVDFIKNYGVPDIISFDHDLADEHYPVSSGYFTEALPYDIYKEKTGYHCAKWLVENELHVKEFRVHSMNPVGAENIRALLSRWKSFCDTEQEHVNRITNSVIAPKE